MLDPTISIQGVTATEGRTARRGALALQVHGQRGGGAFGYVAGSRTDVDGLCARLA
jgi:hypothetical protein